MQAQPQQLFDAACQSRISRSKDLPQEAGGLCPQGVASPAQEAAQVLAGEPLAAAGVATEASCLLGRTRMGRKVLGTTLKVKNTFIDSVAWDDEEDADFGPPMTCIKSCPPVGASVEDGGVHPWWADLKQQPVELNLGIGHGVSQWPSVIGEVGDAAPAYAAVCPTAPICEVRWQSLDGEVRTPPDAVGQVPSDSSEGDGALWPTIFVVQAPPVQVQVQQQQPVGPPSPASDAPHSSSEQPSARPPVASALVAPLEVRTPESSVGSALHGTGECRPCAWFWRPQGCANGGDCRHCHMCLEGEVKTRRKSKIAAMRMQGQRDRVMQ